MIDEMVRLVPLSDAPEYTLNERMPDVRGWDVEAADGEVVGEVRELIVDRAAGRVRYLEVELAPTFAGREGRRVLVPVGLASVDSDDDVVRVLTVTSGAVSGLEAYVGGRVTRAYEVSLRRGVLGAVELPADMTGAGRTAEESEALSAAGRAAGSPDAADPFYDHEHFDERRMLAGRRADDEDKDFSYLLGVGGAMTERDVHPEIVGEVNAGQINIPVVQEETRRAVAPEGG
ncbi:MAG: PRC-barrel domain-containing protein [Gemmatimonadaceae bacterium]